MTETQLHELFKEKADCIKKVDRSVAIQLPAMTEGRFVEVVKGTVREIIEGLEKMSNEYEVVGGCYVIQKTTLDNFIESIEK